MYRPPGIVKFPQKGILHLNFLIFEEIKPLIKCNNFIPYYTIISNSPTDIKKCLKDNIDNINTENLHPKDDFLDRLINTKSLKFVYYFTEDIDSSSHSKFFEMGRNTWD